MKKLTAEVVTLEFFKRRFPEKDIKFEKKCGYFGEWVERFMSGMVETYMDEESKSVWKEMQTAKVEGVKVIRMDRIEKMIADLAKVTGNFSEEVVKRIQRIEKLILDKESEVGK